tara:strand:- start:123 stop:524 length:402 start_codon:yes stop_codon:yes gene_type:complete
MPRYKVVDNVRIQLTAEEETQLDADAEANDLDLGSVRQQRNGMLSASDWTRLDDAALGDHTAAEWATYRQALRDYPAQSDRVSTLPAWPESPPAAKITRKTTAGDSARQSSIDGGGTDEEAQTAYDTAYAATD